MSNIAMQVDNPLQDAAYPVMVTSPNTQSSYGLMATAVAAAATAAMPKPAALCLRLSLWRSRPGGVVCVERLEMQTSRLLLEVEQMHALQLMQVARSMLAPITDDSAQAIRYPPLATAALQCSGFACDRYEPENIHCHTRWLCTRMVVPACASVYLLVVQVKVA